jgi:hypothetical protein
MTILELINQLEDLIRKGEITGNTDVTIGYWKHEENGSNDVCESIKFLQLRCQFDSQVIDSLALHS